MLIELSTGEKCSSEALWQMQHNKAKYSVQCTVCTVYTRSLLSAAAISSHYHHHHKSQSAAHASLSTLLSILLSHTLFMQFAIVGKKKVESEWDDLATVNCNKTEPQADPFVWQLEDVR